MIISLYFSPFQVREALLDVVCVVVLGATTIFGGVAVAVYFCWRVALVILATLPILVVAGRLLSSMIEGSNKEAIAAYKDSQVVANRGLTNSRLFTMLGMNQHLLKQYVYLFHSFPSSQSSLVFQSIFPQ
jgi:hypothetical protein